MSRSRIPSSHDFLWENRLHRLYHVVYKSCWQCISTWLSMNKIWAWKKHSDVRYLLPNFLYIVHFSLNTRLTLCTHFASHLYSKNGHWSYRGSWMIEYIFQLLSTMTQHYKQSWDYEKRRAHFGEKLEVLALMDSPRSNSSTRSPTRRIIFWRPSPSGFGPQHIVCLVFCQPTFVSALMAFSSSNIWAYMFRSSPQLTWRQRVLDKFAQFW